MIEFPVLGAKGAIAFFGLFPQFWEQLFTHFFWALMIEEFLFLLLATTLTFHYFFWDKLWGHKKLHILLGAMMTPLFILQMYMINALGGFMMTPGIEEEGVLTQFEGVLGYATEVMYNPSFLMPQLHRTFANVSYAGFGLAGWCGLQLFLTNNEIRKDYYHKNARLSFISRLPLFSRFPSSDISINGRAKGPDRFLFPRLWYMRSQSFFWVMLITADFLGGGGMLSYGCSGRSNTPGVFRDSIRRTTGSVVVDRRGGLDSCDTSASARAGLLIIATIITSLYPAPTVLLSRLVYHERLGLRRIFGLGLSITGIALISV